MASPGAIFFGIDVPRLLQRDRYAATAVLRAGEASCSHCRIADDGWQIERATHTRNVCIREANATERELENVVNGKEPVFVPGRGLVSHRGVRPEISLADSQRARVSGKNPYRPFKTPAKQGQVHG